MERREEAPLMDPETDAATTAGLPDDTVDVPPNEVNRYQLGLLAVAHALTDSYGSSLLAPLFPLIARKLDLTLAMVGSLSMVMGISASFAQPILGLMSDRFPRLALVAIGPAVAALFCGLVGWAPSYAMLLLVLLVAGVGIGSFHPQGARIANDAGRGSGLAMSVFTVGGNIGFGLAPLMGAFYFSQLGFERWYMTALPGLILAGLLGVAFQRSGCVVPQAEPAGDLGRNGYPGALALLTIAALVRSLIPIGMAVYLPFYVQGHGIPGLSNNAAKAFVVSALLIASALSGPVGGHLSDRLGWRRVMLVSILLTPWPLLASFHLPGHVGVALLMLGGFINMLPHPSSIVVAQQLLPNRQSIAASMITGLAWGAAGLFAIPMGAIADHVGVGLMLRGLSLVPLVGLLAVIPLHDE